eukprot:scaffold237298_cov35-Attheya_sp.AAC.2
MRRTVIEGEFAVFSNILYVPVEELDNNHSYSSLVDIVKDLIATGNELDLTGHFVEPNATSVSSIGQTRRARKIYETSRFLNNGLVLTLCITLWSDDFEPSNVKQNRNSLWVLTCTISPPKHRTHTSENTYIIAMLGPKNANHEVVWRRLQHDSKDLSGSFTGERPSFYHSGLKRNIHVHAEIHCIMNVLAIAKVVPSCETCMSNKDGKLNPGVITYESLRSAADKSHNKIVDQAWKPKSAKAYLSVAGWNGQEKDKIIEHAVNALKWKEAINKRIAREIGRDTKLALSFCKALLPFAKGTLGGCVSENHMAFARVGKWFFASIESITA